MSQTRTQTLINNPQYINPTFDRTTCSGHNQNPHMQELRRSKRDECQSELAVPRIREDFDRVIPAHFEAPVPASPQDSCLACHGQF